MNLKMGNKATINVIYVKGYTEINAFQKGLSLPIMKKVFQINEFPYSVRYPKIVAFFQNGKMKIMKTRGCVFHFLPEDWQ